MYSASLLLMSCFLSKRAALLLCLGAGDSSVHPILMNAISYECLEGKSLHLAKGTEGEFVTIFRIKFDTELVTLILGGDLETVLVV